MAEFFAGDRNIVKFSIAENNGKRLFECNISEKWVPIVHDTARCGACITCKLVRRVGLKKSDKEVLENHVKGSIGIKGLIYLETQVKKTLSAEIVWDIAFEEERSVVFPSPEYGRYTAIQYQKKRFYDLRFQDTRFLHKDSWQHTICEHTKYYHDDSKKVDYDPSCKSQGPNVGDYDGLLQVDLGNTSFLAGFNRIDDGIELDFRGNKVKFEINGNFNFRATIPKDLIPETLIFLGDITDEKIEADFKPYMEPSIESPPIYQDVETQMDTQEQEQERIRTLLNEAES